MTGWPCDVPDFFICHPRTMKKTMFDCEYIKKRPRSLLGRIVGPSVGKNAKLPRSLLESIVNSSAH